MHLGSRCVNVILASMLMHCYHLNSHLFMNNISPLSFCNCGEAETIFIFLAMNAETMNSRNVLLNEPLPFTTQLSTGKIITTR